MRAVFIFVPIFAKDHWIFMKTIWGKCNFNENSFFCPSSIRHLQTAFLPIGNEIRILFGMHTNYLRLNELRFAFFVFNWSFVSKDTYENSISFILATKRINKWLISTIIFRLTSGGDFVSFNYYLSVFHPIFFLHSFHWCDRYKFAYK